MNGNDQRAALARLIEQHQADYSSLSKLLGRNAAYIQQFIKRGTPRKLDERDRRTLAEFFGVPDSELGSDQIGHNPSVETVSIPRLQVQASAGFGALAEGDGSRGNVVFDASWLRRFSRSRSSDLSLIQVQGDSMFPVLSDGDDILVDRSDGSARLRDGIYVLRRDDALMVKRLAINPASRMVTIKSDNPAYQDWPNCDPATLTIIGRVIWSGRRID